MKVSRVVSHVLLALALILGIGFCNGIETKAATIYDVTDYGADGTDAYSDWYAIQTALNIAKTTDEEITVYIPDGTYYIDLRLDIYSDTVLQLSDKAVIKRMSGFEDIMLTNAADDELEHGGYDRTSNITITGGTWDGAVTDAVEEMNLLYFGHAQDVTVSDVTIKNCYGAHLLELTGVKNATVSNVIFDGFYETDDASQDYYKEALQLDAVTESSSKHYAPYDETVCKDITVTGCSFNNYPCAVGTHSEYEGITGVTITGNTFKNIYNNILWFYNYKDFVVSNNVQVASATTPETFAHCMGSTGTFSGNTVVGTKKNAFYLNNSIVNIENTSITNIPDNAIQITNGSSATIVNCEISEITKNAINLSNGTAVVKNNVIHNCDWAAVYGAPNTNLTVEANKFSSCTDNIIFTSSCSKLVCKNNTIFDSTSCGIFVNNANANTLIEGNNVSVSYDFGILIQGAEGSVIKNNTITGAKKHGIYLRQSTEDAYTSNVTITGNTVTGGTTPIFVRKSNGTTISNNITSGASAQDIFVEDTCKNTTVTGNQYTYLINVYDTTAKVSNNTKVVKKELKQAADGNWYYYENGKINYSFTGLAENASGLWKIEKGKVNFKAKGLYCYDGTWYYLQNGKVDFGYTGLAQYNGSWWYVQKGVITFKYDGVAKNSGGTWYIENSKVDFSKNGLHQRGNWYYFKDGKVNTGFTGLTNSKYGWWYIEKGTITFKYTNLVQYGGSWWYVQNSNITFKYDGVAKNSGGTWYVENSKVDFSKNGLHQRGNWYYFKNGKVNTGFTGLTNSKYGWWYIEKGTITFKYTNLVYYGGSWWYVQNSNITFKYDGLVEFNNATWYVDNSKVNFNYSGTYVFEGKTYQIKNGKVVA